MRDALKAGYFFLRGLLGADRAMYERIKREDLVTVLNFHQVSPQGNSYWPPLHPDHFDDLLGFVKDRFNVVTIAEMADAPTDRPLAVISFDDGYHNFLEYAAPILDKHRIRANMNVIPQCVVSSSPMWNVRLYDFLDSAPKSLIDRIALPGFEARLPSEAKADKLAFGLKISRFLKNRPMSERADLLALLEPLISETDHPRTRMMSVDDIKSILGTHEVGAHSWSHESMEFETDEFFRADVDRCRDFFHDRLGMALDIYAFPNGSHRDSQLDILHSAGVRYALLVGEDHCRRDSTAVSRFTIYGATEWENRFQALGFNRGRFAARTEPRS